MAIEKIHEEATQAIVTPADADRVIQMIEAFEYFKKNALTENDIALINNKPFVKKTGWSKYALACNLSTEVKDEKVEERDGKRIYHFTYRAIHLPTGRYAEAVGSASEAEKKTWNHPEHDVRSLAQTRAFNRCISNLVGGGELSAEEMKGTDKKQRKDIKSEQIKRPASVGHPPGRAPKKPIVQRIDTKTVSYNLAALEYDEEIIGVFEEDGKIIVEPTKILNEEDQYKIDSTLSNFDAEWRADVGFFGRWVIEKRARKS